MLYLHNTQFITLVTQQIYIEYYEGYELVNTLFKFLMLAMNKTCYCSFEFLYSYLLCVHK